jgi:SAM-dependent methyltransferase
MSLHAHQEGQSAASIDHAGPESADGGFWPGFGLSECPSMSGKRVLEIGCGEGARCFDTAAHDAAFVVGVDPLEQSVRRAEQALSTLNPRIRQRVTFFHGHVEELPKEEKFDVILSENALEHVLDVPGLLGEARRRLVPGGRMFIGFGPLYHAPSGDHTWLRSALPGYRYFSWPWGHLLFEGLALRKLSKVHGRPVTKTVDWPYLDLNRHTVDEFERMFRESGMHVLDIRKNYVKSLAGRLFAQAAKLPLLSRYCTLNVYVVLQRDDEHVQLGPMRTRAQARAS